MNSKNTQTELEKRNEKIIALSNEIASFSSFKSYEETLDQMFCEFADSDFINKGDAYFSLIQLKKLIKASCDNFHDLRRNNDKEFSRLHDKYICRKDKSIS